MARGISIGFGQSPLSLALDPLKYWFTPIPTTFTGPVAPTNINPVGNSGGLSPSDFGGLPVFQDRMMEARGFMTTGNFDTYATMDGSGWPSEDFQTYLTEVQNFSTAPSWISGTFKCGYTSKNGGAETITGISATVANKVVVGNTVTFDLTSVSGAAGFKITGTTGGVTNVFAMLPAYNTNVSYNIGGANLFTNEFITAASNMSMQRSLDYSNVLWNTATTTWSGRNTPANTKCNKGWGPIQDGLTSSINGTEGWPVDWFIQLCAQTNSGMWYNSPIGDDGTYIIGLCALIASTLPTNLPVRVELANELWNGVGVGGTAFNAVVNAYNTANPGFLNYDSSSNQTVLNSRYMAYRLHGMCAAMSSAFGSDYGSRARVVFAWQSGGNGLYVTLLALQFFIHQYGSVPPNLVFALAPYEDRDNTNVPGDGIDHEGETGDSVATIQAQLLANGTYQPFLRLSENRFLQAAQNFGILEAYEMGWNIDDETAAANYGPAILDSGMTAVAESHITNLLNSGYSRVNWTTFGILNSGNAAVDPGYGFAKDYATFESSGSPRMAAIQSFSGGLPVPTRNVVSGSGSVVQGVNYADNVTAMSSALPVMNAGTWVGYWSPDGTQAYVGWLINCTAPGTYSLEAFVTTTQSGTPNVWVNGVEVITAAPIGSGLTNSSVALGSVPLVKGPNALMIGNGTNYSGIAFNSLKFV